MIRLICFLMCLSLILALAGCRVFPDNNTVSFYYRLSDSRIEKADSLIQAEKRKVTDHKANTDTLLNLYLAGPADSDLVTPFPKDTIIIETGMSNNSFQIRLSNRFARLTGIDLFIACACLTMTAIELTGAKEVVITTESALMDGHHKITMTADSIFMSDFSTPIPGTEPSLPPTETTTPPTDTN